MKEKPPPMPDLDAGDVPEIRSLPWDELKLVPHKRGRWYCCHEGCQRFSRVLDFGLWPLVRHRARWFNILQRIWLCSRHWPIYRNLLRHGDLKDFPMKSEQDRAREYETMFDPPKPKK